VRTASTDIDRVCERLYAALAQIMASDQHFRERLRVAWMTLQPLEEDGPLPVELEQQFNAVAGQLRTQPALLAVDSVGASLIEQEMLSLYTKAIELRQQQ
jgi:hypothetical protein